MQRGPGRLGGGAGHPGAPGDPVAEFFRRFMPNPQQEMPQVPQQGLGSGFIISADGFILTNAHVIADAGEVLVRLADARREFKAKVVGMDTRTDVALLKVEADGLPVVRLGNSEKLQVGEWVAAIGSPFGFDNSVTAGILSAKHRNLPNEHFVPFLQTDVAVNPGNSGGPLLNLAGEVIGINSLIYSGTGGYMGLSFAIPIEVAMAVAKELQSTGRVSRGRLGVGIQDMTDQLAQTFGLDKPRGALVARVEPDSPAAKAGLQPGDVILGFNGEAIADASQVPRRVASSKPGSQAKLEIWRQRAAGEITVTLGELDLDGAAAKVAPGAPPKASRLGLSLRPLSPDQRRAMGIKFGLVVEATDGSGAAAQLRPGDVILGISDVEVTSLEQFEAMLGKQAPGSSVALLLRRGDGALYVVARVPG